MKLTSSNEACILLIVACSHVVSSAVLRGRGGRLFLAADPPEDPRVPSFPRPFRISDKRVPTGYWRVGCQHDIQTDQRRFYDEFVAKEDRESITPEVCWEFCRHVGGAQFFGLENGDRCYCTPFTKDNKDFAGEMCDMPCVGDNTQMCGNQRLQDVYQMHASGNVPDIVCERPPPPVPHAKVFKSQYYRGVPIICSNAKRDPLMANDNHRCTIECEAGYAAVENTIRCKERGNRLTYSWGQTTGSASCEPVKCGSVPEVNFAKSPRSEMFFPQTAEVQCILGYTFNATDPSDAQATIKCKTDASFSAIKDCIPVQCGTACPSKPEKYPNATAREQGKREFKDTCTYDCEEGFTLDSRSDGGRQFEIDCMHTGEFSEPAKCRPVVCGTAPAVSNGKGVEELPPDHKVVYPEALKYDCNEGYTTNARAKGPTSVEVECKADGLFTQPGPCKPVKVGNPPFVNNSVYVDRPYVYGESVTYTCDDGYTTTGEAGSPDMVTLHTGPDGQWAGSAPRCLPVVCGTVPSFKKSEVDEGAPRLVNFESDSVGFKCLPGYSTVLADDIWEPAHATFMITCQASGQFTTPHECININDCATRNCGTFGTCKDLPDPKGEPLDDYTCNCESGYEITLHNSTIKIGAKMKRCTNINDCPEDACGGRNRDERMRGQCIDEINEYDCLCGAGYEKTKKDANFTCSPIECGKVSAGTHAVVKPSDMDGKVVNYDTESWTVSCDLGYTHTGTANGAKNSGVSCTTTRAFSMTPPCHAVSCGAPKRVGHADMAPKSAELVYEESVVYTCDEGFALEGDPKGKRSFEVHCLAHGGLSYPTTKVGEGKVKAPEPTEAPGGQPKKGTVTTTTTQLSCLPVICGKLPDQDHASWNDTKKFVYAEKARVQCDEGYSTDGSTVDGKDVYKAHCMSDGSFSISSKCQKVKCLTIPEVGHSSHEPKEGPFVYRDEITYKMDPGYKIDVEGVDRIGGTFTCHCDSNGEFNGTCAEKNLDPKPINCGTIPGVENARVTGSTEFGGTLTATADEGYTLDGTAKGRKSFTFSCQANGKFSARQEFERVECGICPEYDHVAKVDFKPASSGGSLLQSGSISSESLKDASYSDEVTYKCETGYRAAPGSGTVDNPVAAIGVSKPAEFSLRCGATGDFGMLNSAERDTNCVPVTCDVQITGKPEIPFLHARDEGRKRLQYKHTQDYICEAGYSLDGKPNGGSEFREMCSDSGSMTAMNKCNDIDWCLDSHCGDNGKCQDGKLAYTCKCDAGYEATLVDAAYETCTQIDECETQRGYEKCGTGGGECKDKTLGYDCKCADGYENMALSNGRDSCVAVLCPALPERDNAVSEMQGQKIAFPEEAIYVCGPGYTTDGDIDGKVIYALSCEADKSLGGVDTTCDPVRCPDAPDVDDATTEEKAKLVYLETREYTCKEGHTTSGEAEGPSAFNISCGSNGELSAARKCLPVSCGETPVVLSADEPDVHAASYGQKVAYECLVGFSLNGEFEKGPTKFELVCEANGSYTGQEICQPVGCGALPDIPNAQFSLDEFHYMDTTSVACNAGYTIDADPDGEGNFVVRCGSDGFFKNPAECKPVTCGKPGSTSGATVPAEAKVYGEEATWTCKEGFSTDGTTSGGDEYVRHCEANGLFGRSSPTNCMDIDYCDTQPCGSSGSCEDLGVGVPAPGYKCTCFEGFEVRKRDDGSEYCHADDCAGDPCGEGGKCTDLSKLGGEQGQYSCECDSGYKLTQPKPGKYTCEREQCGPLPPVNHTQPIGDFAYRVKLWKGVGEAMVDEFFGQQILQSFDAATFKCDRGYSTDQHTSPESKDFRVKCKADGSFSVDLRGEAATSMCLPIMCDEGYLPSITHADLSNSAPFVFQDLAEYKCHAGHTLNGKLDGQDTFKLRCMENGKFSENKRQCFKISCPVPPKPRATAMSSGTAKYDKIVKYQCNYGHFTEGVAEEGRGFFEGICGADGDMVFEGHSSCEPAKCSTTPDQLNVVSNDVSKSLIFQQRVFFQCKPGYTLGGSYLGSTDYLVNCQGDGSLSGSFYNPVFERTVVGGPPEGAACVQSKLRVRGVVTDAEAGSKRLANALVTIKSEGTSKQVRTDSDGIYTVELLAGDMTIEVDAVGYISRKKGPFDIQTSVNPGQGMDIAVSKPLPDDAWRVVMSWNKEPADLDSHTYFGCGFQEHVSVRTGKRSISERAGGLDVSLDRDAAFGYGPETTTIRNAGRCSQLGCCLVEFKVNHHGGSGSLADSGATVTLYKGATKFKKYTVPCTGDSRWWTVFTIDLTSSENKAYEGEWARAPYISWGSTGRSDWSTSFDASRWSKADPPSGGRALIYGLEMKSETKLHHLDAANYFTVQGPAASAPEGCQEVSWAGLLPKEEWAQCPSGYYLTGLYRSGNKYDELDGVEQLDKGYCCTEGHKSHAPAWGKCHVQKLGGGSECEPLDDGTPTALVGLRGVKVAGEPVDAATMEGPKGKSATTSRGVFIGGYYIELGFRTNSQIGKMGTDDYPPSWPHRQRGRGGLGMMANADSLYEGNPALTIDYFLPGSPEESFWIGVNGNYCNNCGSGVRDTTSETEPFASTVTTATYSGLEVTQKITLGWQDKYFKNTITVKNTGGGSLSRVRFMRSHDPDNTVDGRGSYRTQQHVEETFAAGGAAEVVSAKSRAGDAYYEASGGQQAAVVYYTTDKRGRVSFGLRGLRPAGPYDARVYDSPPSKGQGISQDAYISIAFDFGTLSPGQEEKAVYFTALDNRPITEVMSELTAASKEVLTLDEMKCCAVGIKGLVHGGETCSTE